MGLIAWRTKAVDTLAGLLGGVLALSFTAASGAVLALVLAGWLTALASVRAYSGRIHGHGHERMSPVLAAGSRLVAAIAAVGTVLNDVRLEAGVVTALILVGATLLGRISLRLFGERGRPRRVVVRGSRDEVDRFLHLMKGDSSEQVVVGTQVVGPGPAAPVASGAGAIDPTADIVSEANRLEADAVILVGPQEQSSIELRRVVWRLENHSIEALLVPIVLPLSPPRVVSAGRTGLPLLTMHTRDLGSEYGFAKIVLDKVMALLGLVVLSPLLLTIALVVRITSPGPLFFHQVRVGREGRQFTMLKFRTMEKDADRHRTELASLNVHDSGVLFKIKKDPRVTPVGRVLRRYSLDELPQLINVLRGDMSIVGPRPPLPEEVLQYPADAWRRFRVRPGLTGLWQVSGRSDLDPTESMRLDTHYVEHWSPGLDAWILARTPHVVFTGAGAY